jgi:hypothetical protein
MQHQGEGTLFRTQLKDEPTTLSQDEALALGEPLLLALVCRPHEFHRCERKTKMTAEGNADLQML